MGFIVSPEVELLEPDIVRSMFLVVKEEAWVTLSVIVARNFHCPHKRLQAMIIKTIILFFLFGPSMCPCLYKI